jgi:L-fuconolactonase
MKIDAHHHVWRYSPEEYEWIDDARADLRRDFLLPELRAVTQAAGVDHVISVEARPTVEETRWLLQLAEGNELVAGVVGWVPLVAPDVGAIINELAMKPKLRGVRHSLQGEADERYMLRPDFNRGIRTLASYDLTYDILISERQLPQTMAFVDRHPTQRFVLDHLAKPRIRDGALSPWSENLHELARRPNVWCKLSGVVTEASRPSWSEAEIQPYLEAALHAFGPQRLMFGSDWPVCLLASDYARWLNTADRFVSRLNPDEQEQFWWKNAFAAYGLS